MHRLTSYNLVQDIPVGYNAIHTAQDLANIRSGRNYILMNDIDLSYWGEWTPIRNFIRGVLDGNGY